MTIREVKNEVMKIIKESTETDRPVSLETGLLNDLGLSSMEVLVLLGDLEDAFGIVIPVSKAAHVETVEELCQVVIDLLR